MTASERRPAQGFSLIELLTVMVLIAILATIALPRLRSAIDGAHVADILGDVRAVQVAYSQYIMDNGSRTRNSGWGRVPSELVPYLPDGFQFSGDVAEYRWIRLRPKASPWGVEMGEIRVKPRADLRTVLVDKLARMSNQAMIVKKKNHVMFYMVP